MIFNVWKNMWEQSYQIAAKASHAAGETPLNPLLNQAYLNNPSISHKDNYNSNANNKLTNITTQKEVKNHQTNKQQKLNNHLIKHSKQAITLISKDGEISDYSENLSSLIGQKIGDRQNLIFFLHPQHKQAFFNKLFMVLNDFSFRENCTTRYQMKNSDNKYQWFEFHLFKDDSINSNDCVLMLRNIDNEIKTEKELRIKQIETELSQKGRDEFLGHMSHELRTPLNAMLGFAEMMERGVYGKIESPEYQEYLSNIRDSGNLLLHRINDMIDVVTSDVSDNSLNESNIQLEHLVDNAIKLHRYDAFCRNITICHTKNMPRIVIKGEFAKLTRALGNILSNAIRFSKVNQQITLFFEYLPEKGLTITISDDGEGMSKEQLDKITKSLETHDCLFAQNPQSVGVGLGLTVAREFITLHDGKLDILSYKNKGTEVSIFLPTKRIISLEKPISRLSNRKKHTSNMPN